MTRTRSLLMAVLTLVLVTGCVVHHDQVVTEPNADPDCWVKVYDTDNFDTGSSIATIKGPVDLPTLDDLEGKNWGDQIESLIVGPGAEVQVWKSENYTGTALTFQPNQRVEKLGDLNYEDEIDSIKVVCK